MDGWSATPLQAVIHKGNHCRVNFLEYGKGRRGDVVHVAYLAVIGCHVNENDIAAKGIAVCFKLE